jgi:hypothetical protein
LVIRQSCYQQPQTFLLSNGPRLGEQIWILFGLKVIFCHRKKSWKGKATTLGELALLLDLFKSLLQNVDLTAILNTKMSFARFSHHECTMIGCP